MLLLVLVVAIMTVTAVITAWMVLVRVLLTVDNRDIGGTVR